MSETVITVQGRFSGSYAPERASLHLSVGFDDPHRGIAFDNATASADRVRSRISGMLDKARGPIVSFSSDTVQVWSDRPWNQNGLMMDPVFHSRLGFLVKFSDFGALATFIEDLVGVEGVTVGGLLWDLTETTRSAAVAEVRSRAVKEHRPRHGESGGDSRRRNARWGEGWDVHTWRRTGAADGGGLRPERAATVPHA